jgi:hypothetical protein
MLLAGAGHHPLQAAIPEGASTRLTLPRPAPSASTKDSVGDDRRSASRAWIGVLLFPSPGEGLGQARLCAETAAYVVQPARL